MFQPMMEKLFNIELKNIGKFGCALDIVGKAFISE
jgi:hypothetical protein